MVNNRGSRIALNRKISWAKVGAYVAYIILIFVGVAVGQPTSDLLAKIVKTLTGGRVEQMVPLYRYFEESVEPTEVTKDKYLVKIFFLLLEKHFGRLQQFEPISSTTSTFVNVFIESATPDLWRNSDCLFRSYAYKARYESGARRWLVEVIFDLCLDRKIQPAWLRKTDVHFLNPDEATMRSLSGFFQEFKREVEKARNLQS